MNKYLMRDERIITSSDNYVVVLTNLRIRSYEEAMGKAHIVSILLEKISSIEMRYKSNLILLFLAILAAIGGLIVSINTNPGGYHEYSQLGLACFGGAALFFILFLISRRHYLTISSDGGAKIDFLVKGMKREKVLDFINQLESATRERREEISKALVI